MTWCNAVNLIVKFISFADDATLFRHILKDSDNCFLQSGIHSLKQWSDHWLLKLNISKYKIVSFGRYVDKNYVYNINENIRLHHSSTRKVIRILELYLMRS